MVGDFNLTRAPLQAVTAATDRTTGSGSTLNSEGGRTANLYDHLLVRDVAASSELEGNAVVLDVLGQVANGKTFHRTVSDHLPIVGRWDSSGPDDD